MQDGKKARQKQGKKELRTGRRMESTKEPWIMKKEEAKALA